MTSKITTEAAERCSRTSFHDQLEQVRKELTPNRRHTDRSDVDLAFDADAAWGGHHARLVMPVEGAD